MIGKIPVSLRYSVGMLRVRWIRNVLLRIHTFLDFLEVWEEVFNVI
jgi:hypothetical protein